MEKTRPSESSPLAAVTTRSSVGWPLSVAFTSCRLSPLTVKVARYPMRPLPSAPEVWTSVAALAVPGPATLTSSTPIAVPVLPVTAPFQVAPLKK
jgi:hypothetical protein